MAFAEGAINGGSNASARSTKSPALVRALMLSIAVCVRIRVHFASLFLQCLLSLNRSDVNVMLWNPWPSAWDWAADRASGCMSFIGALGVSIIEQWLVIER